MVSILRREKKTTDAAPMSMDADHLEEVNPAVDPEDLTDAINVPVSSRSLAQ